MTSDGSEETPQAPKIDVQAIRDAVERDSRLVPYIGDRWTRWYDLPYKIAGYFVWGRMPRRLLPYPLREQFLRLANFLSMFNDLERDRISTRFINRDSLKLPLFEEIDMPAMWVCEFFTPTYAATLQQRLARRDWPRQWGGVPGDELVDQLRRIRQHREGAISVIGSFISPTSRFLIPGARREQLPNGIDHIQLRWEAIGPSLTAVIGVVYLTDDATRRVDAAIRADHAPRIVRSRGSWHLYQRAFQGINDVQGARADLHDAARKWLSRKLPGLFAQENEGQLPILDMVLTKLYDPDQHNPLLTRSSYIRALGVAHNPWSSITSPDLPGFHLREYHPDRLRRDTYGIWSLVGNYYRVLNEENFRFSSPRGRTPGNIAQATNDEASALLTRLALFEFVDLKRRQQGTLRDLARRAHGGNRPAHGIKLLRRSVLTSNLDLSAVSNDLEDFTKQKWRYQWNVPTLHRVADVYQLGSGNREPDPPDTELLRQWARRQRLELRDLLKGSEELTALLQVASSLTASLSSIRSQRIALGVSVGSLIAALIAALFAYLALR